MLLNYPEPDEKQWASFFFLSRFEAIPDWICAHLDPQHCVSVVMLHSDSFWWVGGQLEQGWHFTKLPLLKVWAAHFRYGISDLPPSSCMPQFGLNSCPGQKNVYLFVDYKCVLCTDKHQNVSTSNKDDLFRMSSSPGWIGCCGCWWHGTHLFLDSSQNVSKSSEQLSE